MNQANGFAAALEPRVAYRAGGVHEYDDVLGDDVENPSRREPNFEIRPAAGSVLFRDFERDRLRELRRPSVVEEIPDGLLLELYGHFIDLVPDLVPRDESLALFLRGIVGRWRRRRLVGDFGDISGYHRLEHFHRKRIGWTGLDGERPVVNRRGARDERFQRALRRRRGRFFVGKTYFRA